MEPSWPTHPCRLSTPLQLRRTVLALLHGAAGHQAAEVLLVSRERFNQQCLQDRSSWWGGNGVWNSHMRVLDKRLLWDSARDAPGGSPSDPRAPFMW